VAPSLEQAPPSPPEGGTIVETSKTSRGKTIVVPSGAEEGASNEFDLSDITHNPVEKSREDIIAAAEAAAFAE
jgi:ribonuclease-3